MTRDFWMVGRSLSLTKPLGSMPLSRSKARRVSPMASEPMTPARVTRPPRPAMLQATLAAPPGLTSSRSTCTTGMGASGLMRSTLPKT